MRTGVFYGYGRVLPVLIHKDDTSQTDAPDLKHTLAIAIKFAEFRSWIRVNLSSSA